MKEIIEREIGEWRFVAAGKTLYWGKRWKTFPDFLGAYLAGSLGSEWGERQAILPIELQHPIAQWRTIFNFHMQDSKPHENGLYRSNLGVANALFRLAYDLYLVEHNAELQKRLIQRLRDPEKFQGARFEAAVAAMMLASGYDLRFDDEKGPGKHPEFYATHRETGQILAVEAKSRHRPGILGFESEAVPTLPTSIKIDGLLSDALEKDTKTPLLVFIELNIPLLMAPETFEAECGELPLAWAKIQRRQWKNGFPGIGAVFYNDVAPWYLRDSLPDLGAAVWSAAYWPEKSRHSFHAKPLLHQILHGCIQRGAIPLEFPPKFMR